MGGHRFQMGGPGANDPPAGDGPVTELLGSMEEAIFK